MSETRPREQDPFNTVVVRPEFNLVKSRLPAMIGVVRRLIVGRHGVPGAREPFGAPATLSSVFRNVASSLLDHSVVPGSGLSGCRSVGAGTLHS
jgi:hypothetical protein